MEHTGGGNGTRVRGVDGGGQWNTGAGDKDNATHGGGGGG